eukprot:CAMPEP_0170627940 /NCGR_PEP_ID=MMETSP0224-20130122/32339_1 /TAXON_ID=285029 /ORGANISM="Togula jolla, Strain CCCM 725" /LENGTH=158 /DNA_ID=CAMNT_0010955173 /DNA_START=65 /DNA_END=541 /DNA_ORIENTATION=-
MMATMLSRRSRASSPAPRKSVTGKVDEETKENPVVNFEAVGAEDVAKPEKAASPLEVAEYTSIETPQASRTRGLRFWLSISLAAMLFVTVVGLFIAYYGASLTEAIATFEAPEVPQLVAPTAAVVSGGLVSVLVLTGCSWLLARRLRKVKSEAEGKDA